jgi:hypothetical protein
MAVSHSSSTSRSRHQTGITPRECWNRRQAGHQSTDRRHHLFDRDGAKEEAKLPLTTQRADRRRSRRLGRQHRPDGPRPQNPSRVRRSTRLFARGIRLNRTTPVTGDASQEERRVVHFSAPESGALFGALDTHSGLRPWEQGLTALSAGTATSSAAKAFNTISQGTSPAINRSPQEAEFLYPTGTQGNTAHRTPF